MVLHTLYIRSDRQFAELARAGLARSPGQIRTDG